MALNEYSSVAFFDTQQSLHFQYKVDKLCKMCFFAFSVAKMDDAMISNIFMVTIVHTQHLGIGVTLFWQFMAAMFVYPKFKPIA